MTHDVLIVGAGPYGIAVALEVRARGGDPLVVGDPFALWHRHTLDVMSLRSDPRMSSVGSFDFGAWLERRRGEGGDGSAFDGTRVGIADFRVYLREVEEQLPFPLLRRQVERLEQLEGASGDAAGFRATLDDGSTVEAPSVVVATGSGAHTHVPDALRHLPPERVLHSWDVEAIQALRDRRVLVVGAGQSAAETVEALADDNRVTWVLRHPPSFYREPLRAPTPVFKTILAVSPALYKVPRGLRRALQDAFFHTTVTPDLKPIYERDDVVKLEADAADLALAVVPGAGNPECAECAESGRDVLRCGLDGRFYDVVVAATGFRYSLRGLPFLSDALAEALGPRDAVPPLDDDFQTPIRGLYLAGGIAEGAFGPAQRFLLGSRHASSRIARSIARTVSRAA